MSERFFVRVYSNNEPFFFDEKQEYVEERYTCEDVRNLHPMEYWQVVELLNEQQATIRKLQDLCGESDSENAKLRLKNKELQEEIKLLKPTNVEQYEQIVQLQEENEQLKNKLNKEYIKERSIK